MEFEEQEDGSWTASYEIEVIDDENLYEEWR